MEKSEFRTLIKHYFLRNKTIKQTEQSLLKYYGNSSPSIETIHHWFDQFQSGRNSTDDAECSGRPVQISTPKLIHKIRDMILHDPRIKVRELVANTGLSHESVISILNKNLNMKKLYTKWVPRSLTNTSKRNRLRSSTKCLTIYNRNPNQFLQSFVTVDKTWIHYNTTETKEESQNEPESKKAKLSLSTDKVMATVFWDARGVIHIDYLEKGDTINATDYVELLNRFDAELKQKRPNLTGNNVFFYQNSIATHESPVAMEKLHELGYELLPHAAYSPDLAPSDYFLFPNIKKCFDGKKLKSNQEVISETNAYFESLEKSYYLESIKKLEKRWTKCIELEGDYVEI